MRFPLSKLRLWWSPFLPIPLLMAACAHSPELPKEVLVPVPVPCEIEQVPATELPQVSPDMNVFQAARIRMAQLQLLLAENTRLRAANNRPCTPTEETK